MLTCISYKHTLIRLDDSHYLLTISIGSSQATFKLKNLTQGQVRAIKLFLEDTFFWSYFLRQMNKLQKNIDFASVLVNVFIESLSPNIFLERNIDSIKMPLGLALLLKKTVDFVVDK